MTTTNRVARIQTHGFGWTAENRQANWEPGSFSFRSAMVPSPAHAQLPMDLFCRARNAVQS